MWGLVWLMCVALGVLVLIGTLVLAHVLTHPPRRTEGSAAARGNPLDPCEAGAPSYQTIRPPGFPDDVWDVRGLDPAGPCIVMIHGWGDSRFGSLLWLEALLPSASRLILWDLPGHGEASDPICTWGMIESRRLAMLIKWLRDEKADCGMVLFGCSLGAVIAIHAAAEGGSPIDAVIADSPLASIRAAVARTMKRDRLPTWPIVPAALELLRLRGRMPESDDFLVTLRRVHGPILCLRGLDDVLFTDEDAQAIGGDRSVVIAEFPDCGHLGPACADGTGYVTAIRRFLEDNGLFAKK